MAQDIEILGQLFGSKELVDGLSALQRQMRSRIYGGLKALAKAYAQDVATSGLAELGIKQRSGRLAGSMMVRGSLGSSSARVLVYPNAVNPKTKYRYPWALGQGSPKNEIQVRAYARAVAGGGTEVTVAIPGKARGATKRRGARHGVTYQTVSGAQRVKAHRRKVRLPARPFMSGSAFGRLQAVFAQRMEQTIAAAVADAKAVQAAQAAPGDFDGAGVS